MVRCIWGGYIFLSVGFIPLIVDSASTHIQISAAYSVPFFCGLRAAVIKEATFSNHCEIRKVRLYIDVHSSAGKRPT
jgi:hypothetical protein